LQAIKPRRSKRISGFIPAKLPLRSGNKKGPPAHGGRPFNRLAA
jgi:hypothetical protein